MEVTTTPETTDISDAISDAREADKTSRDGAVARMDVYVEWLLVPVDSRIPKFKKDLAALLDITVETLRKYDHDPWVRKEYLKRSRVAFTVSRAAAVIDNLFRRATDPMDPQGVTAARTLMQYFVAQDETEAGERIDLSSMTSDELVELALRVASADAKGKRGDS